MPPGVKYIGPVFDGSGYAEAARNYVLSIYRKGYPITLAPITFEQARPDLGKDGEILRSLVNRNIEYDKVITHCTPDLWSRINDHERNKYNIGYTVWETSKIHSSWVPACNKVNEVWLPCDWNMKVFRESGVTVPLHKIPHAIRVPDLDLIPNFDIKGISQNDFVFYSIFQWQERKHPYALLSAYNAAFTEVDDVVMVLKTYMHSNDSDRDEIIKLIKDYKAHINLKHYPKMYIIVENMSSESIMALHKRGDCFSLLQRSEGWGLPHFEAASVGNPVITPSYGGQTDFLNEQNSYPINYTLAPVSGMSWSPYYTGDQMWCEPDLEHAINQMRHVYNNRDEARAKGEQARNDIQKNFSLDCIGDKIVKRLVEIDQGGVNV